jgi:type I restriction enzyme S subunit
MNKERENKTEPKFRFPEFKKEDGWAKKEFNELFEIGNGKDYKHLSKGIIPVYGSGGYMLSIDEYLYDGESVCIGRKGTIDKPMFLSGKFWVVDTLFYTHSFKDCLPKFIYSIFQNINWRNYNEAGGVPSLTKTTINKIEVYVPKLNEQQKIADCLSSLDDLIKANNEKLEALKAHKKGLMQQLFPAEGETVPKLRFEEFRESGEWEERTLGNIATFFKGKGISKSDIVDNGNLECIRYGELYTYYKEIIDAVKSYTNVLPDDLVLSQANDVIIPSSGETREDIARACCVLRSGIALGGDLNIIRPEINGIYLSYYLSNAKKGSIAKLAQGNTVVHLYLSQLEKLKINFPKLKNEQRRIAECLSSLDELITAQTEKIEALIKHKKGLMQVLFPEVNNDN